MLAQRLFLDKDQYLRKIMTREVGEYNRNIIPSNHD